MLRLTKQTDEKNVFGFDIIDIIQFNYDGQGTALCKIANMRKDKNDKKKWELIEYGKSDLLLLLGLNPDEHPMCYNVSII